MQLQNKKTYVILIGIDAGVNTGICFYHRSDKRIGHLATVKIHNAMDLVRECCCGREKEVFVRVEDARQATYGRLKDLNKAQGAGSVKRDAKIWEDFLKSLGVDFEMVRPNKKVTKLKPDVFKRVTGYIFLASEHARDAAMLVYGF